MKKAMATPPITGDKKKTRRYRQDFTAQRFTALLCLGFTASIGFALSGMSNADHIFQFFNFKRFETSTWDPSLLFTFASALGSHLILYQLIIAPRKLLRKPVFGDEFSIPKPSTVDFKLVFGEILFGIGWAMSGFCPGPSITAAFAGNKAAVIFLVFVFLGFWIANRLSTSGIQATYPLPQLLSSLSLFGLLGLAYFYAPPSLSALSPGSAIASPVFGGLIIGGTAFAMMFSVGRVLGISGLTSGLILPSTTTSDRLERWFFFFGLILGGIYTRLYLPRVLLSTLEAPQWRIVLGGVLVGLGTNLGNGCTSGHGICGISRGSIRSIVATAAFFLTNLLLSTFVLGI